MQAGARGRMAVVAIVVPLVTEALMLATPAATRIGRTGQVLELLATCGMLAMTVRGSSSFRRALACIAAGAVGAALAYAGSAHRNVDLVNCVALIVAGIGTLVGLRRQLRRGLAPDPGDE